ncbi:MAG: polyphosphate polymerase domain-containing protein [Verrucomicrobia bacterium]|nr:polyphosphate polymerase domain-containing protein [Verrucomicrobiota bacterium]
MSDSDESEFRFERKYHISEVPLAEVEDWVRRSPALFHEIYRPRYINNIYLDTPGLSAYFQNIDGLAARTKLRIRWYGALLGPVAKPVLEFKIKKGMVGTKEFYPLRPFELTRGFGLDQLQTLLEASDLPPQVWMELHPLEPALINRYHRKYFLSADGHYRITIDSQLEFYRVYRRNNQFLTRSRLPESTVMELKYSGRIADLDERIANFFPFRVTRMSKYITGMDLLDQ